MWGKVENKCEYKERGKRLNIKVDMCEHYYAQWRSKDSHKHLRWRTLPQ